MTVTVPSLPPPSVGWCCGMVPFVFSLVTKAWLPSGAIATPCGRAKTGSSSPLFVRLDTTSCDAVSMTSTPSLPQLPT